MMHPLPLLLHKPNTLWTDLEISISWRRVVTSAWTNGCSLTRDAKHLLEQCVFDAIDCKRSVTNDILYFYVLF